MLPVVLTRSGSLEGEIVSQGVQAFRGIPFAAAPVGELRFRAPQPLPAWSGTRSARAFGASAMQDSRMMPDVGACSEDCLFLNVWTPACDNAKRPVMVWVHGGGFTIGSSSQPMYDGAALAKRGDVVVVTFNYRLGIFGYGFFRDVLGANAGRVDSNTGLRDQLAALRWVHANIEAFGGDPENVTLFGESAGAMSVGALLAAPSGKGLFRRAIAQSGAAHHSLSAEHATQVAARFMAGLDATVQHPDALWTATPEALLEAQRACGSEEVALGPAGKRLPQTGVTLMPVVDGDVLPQYPLTAIERGCAADIDLVIGTNAEEWNYFLFLMDPKKRDIDIPALLKVCERRVPGHGAAAVELYRDELGPEAPAWKIFSAVETDKTFWAPAVRLAELQARHNPRTFMYRFDYPSPLFQFQMGACHALEIPFVFGGLATAFGRAFAGEDPAAQPLSDAMLSAWTSFARSGEPGDEVAGAWAPYDSATRRTKRFAEEVTALSDPRPAPRLFWDGLR